MTQEMFNYLFDHNEINVKCYSYIDSENAPSYCEAFEYGGKYYLRFDIHYIKHTTKHGRDVSYRMGNAFIKEFTNKNAANAYFKKVFAGLGYSKPPERFKRGKNNV